MESSKGSLRFDEFPTSMKATQSLEGSRATRLLAYENARPSESRRQPTEMDRHARTPPSAFPFLHITMSKSLESCGRLPPPEPPMEANPPSGVNDSRGKPRGDSSKARFCPVDRAVAYNPAGTWERPARRGHLRRGPRFVKGGRPLSPLPLFPLGCDNQATFLPECAVTLLSLTVG